MPAAAQQAPRTVIPWIAEQRARPGPDYVRPYAEPDIEALLKQARAESAAADREETETLVRDVENSIIGANTIAPADSASGFDSSIWPDLPRPQLVDAIATSVPSGSHATDLLLKRILITPATVFPNALAAERANALLALGATPEAFNVAVSAPQPDPETLAVLVRAGLLLGRGEDACGHARSVSDLLPAGIAGIFCLMLAGDTDRASTLLETAIRSGDITETETALIDAVADPELKQHIPEPAEDAVPTDYEIGLLRHLDQSPPAGVLESGRHAHLWQFAGPGEPPATRATALERLEPSALVGAEDLVQAYAELPPDGSEESQQLWVRLLDAVRSGGDARLVRIAEGGLQLGRIQKREGSAARMLAPMLRRLFPTSDTESKASIMQRLFLLAGDPDSALVWVPQPPAAAESMLLAIALPDPPGDWNPAPVAELEERYERDGDPGDGRLLAALAAFGRATPTPRMDAETLPGLAEQLREAEGAGAALVALSALRDNPTPGTLYLALTALRSAGFEAPARQAALEAILLGNPI